MSSHHRRRRDSSSSSSGEEDNEGSTRATPHRPSRRQPGTPIQGIVRDLQGLGIRSPHTPHHSHSPSTPQVPGAPNPSRSLQLIRPQPNQRLPKIAADQVLLEHLFPCRPITKHYAKVSARAKEEGYDRIPFSLVPWEREEVHDEQFLDRLFANAIVHHGSQLHHRIIEQWPNPREYGQLENDLITEADVADCVRANVLNPLAEIFTSFISPGLQVFLHCVVRNQQNVRRKHPKSQTNHTLPSPARLDHAIFLTERNPPLGQDYELQIPLVIVEEKAPGIIRKEDWEAPLSSNYHDPKENWMGRLLPQLFLYSDHMECSRFFLTNYTQTYCVRIDEETLTRAADELESRLKVSTRVGVQVRSATNESDHDSTDKDAFDFGFRIGLAYEVFHALFELGVANFELIDKNMSKDDRYPVDDKIKIFVDKHILRGRRNSQSPTRGPDSFEYKAFAYSAPPPSP